MKHFAFGLMLTFFAANAFAIRMVDKKYDRAVGTMHGGVVITEPCTVTSAYCGNGNLAGTFDSCSSGSFAGWFAGVVSICGGNVVINPNGSTITELKENLTIEIPNE